MSANSVSAAALTCALTILGAAAAEARCVKHVGGGGGRDIGAASAQALAAWVKDASRRSADAANWSKAKNMEVTCKKVITGSGPARGPRWNCEATGSSTDVVGGEPCPK